MVTLEILLFLIGAEIVAVLGLLAASLLTQARNSGRKALERSALCSLLLPDALQGDQDALSSIRASLKSNADWKAFHGLVDEQMCGIRGCGPLNLRRLSRHVDLTGRLHSKLLHSRNPLDRAQACRTLARLGEGVVEEQVLGMLRSDDPAVVLAAAHAVAAFRDSGHFLTVFRAIYGRTPITLHGAAELLSAFGEGVCPAIHELLAGVVGLYERMDRTGSTESVDPAQALAGDDIAAQVVFVDLLAFHAYRPAGTTLRRLLSLSQSEEVLIHLVKAVAALGETAAVPRLLELLDHSNWVIRDQSLRALGAVGAVRCTRPVRRLLADRSLAVRMTARETLHTFDLLKNDEAALVSA